MKEKWLVGAMVAVATWLIAGCSVSYPGDGHLVVVEIDRDLDQCNITMSTGPNRTLGDAIRVGIRYWDDVGARFRTLDQVLPGERKDLAAAPRLRVRGDACAAAGKGVVAHASGVAYEAMPAGQYDRGTGEITLFLRTWTLQGLSPQDLLGLQAEAAHEAGHALGLGHVQALDAIMNANAYPRPDLGDADLREFARIGN